MNAVGWVALGGAVGAVGRYLISGWVYQQLGRGFPWGTLTVNVGGSFLMGLLFSLLTERWMVADAWRSVILVGGLGALTTFSTFSIETLNLLEGGQSAAAMLNVVVSVVVCIGAVWVGMALGRLG